jgi:hypothetical protein
MIPRRRSTTKEHKNFAKKSQNTIDTEQLTHNPTRIPAPPIIKQSSEPLTVESLLSKQNISKIGKTQRGGYAYFYK